MLVHRHVDVPLSADAAWKWFEDLSHWNFLVDTFAGKRGFYRHEARSGGSGGASSMRIRLADRKGREHLVWDVSEWTPPKRMAYRAAQTEPARFEASLTVDLEPLSAASTRVRMGLGLSFANFFLKGISDLPPVRWIYDWQLKRALAAMQFSII